MTHLKVIKHHTGEMDDILVVKWDDGIWTFYFNGGDPGLDWAVTPTGRLVDTYEPFGSLLALIPEALWVAVQAHFEAMYG